MNDSSSFSYNYCLLKLLFFCKFVYYCAGFEEPLCVQPALFNVPRSLFTVQLSDYYSGVTHLNLMNSNRFKSLIVDHHDYYCTLLL